MANAQVDRDWHRADVMAALRKTEEKWSLRRLSLAHGYAENAVSEALNRPWPAVERVVANALGLDPWEIWPSRYTTDHQPKRGRLPDESWVEHRRRQARRNTPSRG